MLLFKADFAFYLLLKRLTCRWLCYSVLISLYACRLGPSYTPPAVEIPDQWKACHETEDSVSSPSHDRWWEVFNDNTLNCLENQAIENSPNLYIALQRVFEARALAGVSKANLYPQLTIDPSYTNSGMLYKFFGPAGVIPFNQRFFRIHQVQYNLPLDMNYELDLWGKLRSQYDYQFRTAQAQEEALHTTLLSLTADVASNYFLLRSLDAQLVFYHDTINSLQKEVQLVTSRYENGLVNFIDVTNASLQLSNAKADYEDLLRQRALQEDALAVLIGEIPSEFCLESMPLSGSPPMIPPSTPASVLIKRPDIAQAERTRAAQHAMIGAAYASFLPSISISGTLGFSSPDIKQFLSWNSRLWAMGANASQPVFDGGRNRSNLEAAWAVFMEADGNYQEQVLIAFKEVEDALNNLSMQASQAGFLAESVDFANKTYASSQKRYVQGLVGYLEVVENQKAALNAERAWITLQGVRFLSTIQLIKSLGGSWDSCEATEAVF